MGQTRLHVTAPRPVAERVFAELEWLFEDDGFPLALLEVDEARALHEVSLYVEADRIAHVRAAMQRIATQLDAALLVDKIRHNSAEIDAQERTVLDVADEILDTDRCITGIQFDLETSTHRHPLGARTRSAVVIGNYPALDDATIVGVSARRLCRAAPSTTSTA